MPARSSSAAWPGRSPTASRRSRSDSTAANGRRPKLGPSGGVEYWRQWYLPWKAESGSHQIAVRATNRKGETQTAARATPFPDGSSGIQEVVVTVA